MKDLSPSMMFYLEHQDHIDEWAALRKDVCKLAHEFFSHLKESLEARRAELPGAPILHASLDEECPKLFFALPSWRVAEGEDLRAGIGLEWLRTKTDFRSSYSGAWVDLRLDGSSELTTAVRQRLEPMLVGRPYKRTRWWPAMRIEPPAAEDYWLDFDRFAVDLVDRVCDQWRLMYEAVDEAVTATSVAS